MLSGPGPNSLATLFQHFVQIINKTMDSGKGIIGGWGSVIRPQGAQGLTQLANELSKR